MQPGSENKMRQSSAATAYSAIINELHEVARFSLHLAITQLPFILIWLCCIIEYFRSSSAKVCAELALDPMRELGIFSFKNQHFAIK